MSTAATRKPKQNRYTNKEMFGFGSSATSVECALIIDIGSGSAGAALILSDAQEDTFTTLWTHREYVTLGEAAAADISIKQLNAALMNLFLEFGSKGQKALSENESRPKVGYMQVTISAPWTHTVMKQVRYNDDVAFTITPALVAEITEAATKQATELILKDSDLSAKGVVAIDNQNIGVIANGYPTNVQAGAEARDMSIAHLTALTQKTIVEAVEEIKDKLMPRAQLFTHSFMYVYYQMMHMSRADTTEVCLVDITSEATEVGIVRNGILTHVSHMPHGTYTLAREVASICGIPKTEALSYLRGGKGFIEDKLTKTMENELTIAFTAYEERLAKLLKETGDRLAIPKTVFVHTSLNTEKFFKKHVSDAATIATGMKHTLHMVTGEIVAAKDAKETALHLSAMYFHTKHKQTHLEG